MKLTQRKYFEYMEALARNHKGIGHTDDEKHFGRILPDARVKDPFGRLNIDEILNGLKSTLKTPMLICVGYEAGVKDEGGDNRMKVKSGALILLDKPKNIKDLQESITVIDAMETLADELIGYMDEDWQTGMENGNTAGRLNLRYDDMIIYPISGAKDNLCGVRVDIAFVEQSESTLAYNPDRFNTPLALSF
jgi:hypothetical protein